MDFPRNLTSGETNLLRDIFGNTIDYERQIVSKNVGETGGPNNSWTPGYVPNMSPSIWSTDYSMEDAAKAAVFVHEMVHVWQSGHGHHNLLRGFYLWMRYDHFFGDYDDSYKYDLDSSTDFDYFNMEQQGRIIEDYYRVTHRLQPRSNEGTRKEPAHYQPYVDQLKAAGPFEWPPTVRKFPTGGRNAP